MRNWYSSSRSASSVDTNPYGRPMHVNEHAARNVTIDTCHALQLHLEPRPSEVSRSVII